MPAAWVVLEVGEALVGLQLQRVLLQIRSHLMIYVIILHIKSAFIFVCCYRVSRHADLLNTAQRHE